jgi:hypothetical protein
MRTFMFAVLLCAAPAAADPPRLVEDGSFGLDPPATGPLLAVPDAALAKCTEAPTGSALYWVEVGKDGRVTSAHVHGTGKLDACLEKALEAGKVATKLTGSIVVLGHVEAADQPKAKISTVPIIVDAHDAAWQVTVERVAYTANRVLDIGQDLDTASAAIDACAAKRGKPESGVAHGVAWTDGHPIVHTGSAAYDACLAHALAAIKLPRDDSALWMELSIAPPAEPLAPRNSKVISHDQELRDALTTAVRSRKLRLLGCLDGHPKTTLTHVELSLAKGHAAVKTVSTGDADADACVRKLLDSVAIPSAIESDRLELDITLDPD